MKHMNQAYTELVERQAARSRRASAGYRTIPRTNVVAYPHDAMMRLHPSIGTKRARNNWQAIDIKEVEVDGQRHLVQVIEPYEQAKERRKREAREKFAAMARERALQMKREASLRKARATKANKRIRLQITTSSDHYGTLALLRQHLQHVR
jgi:hypothetical protein